MCKGLTPQEAAGYLLPLDALQMFRYLNSSGCTDIEGICDAEEFGEVRCAMEAVGICGGEQELVRRAIDVPDSAL